MWSILNHDCIFHNDQWLLVTKRDLTQVKLFAANTLCKPKYVSPSRNWFPLPQWMVKSGMGVEARFDDSEPLPCHVYLTKLSLMILGHFLVMNIPCKLEGVDFYVNDLLGPNGSWELWTLSLEWDDAMRALSGKTYQGYAMSSLRSQPPLLSAMPGRGDEMWLWEAHRKEKIMILN